VTQLAAWSGASNYLEQLDAYTALINTAEEGGPFLYQQQQQQQQPVNVVERVPPLQPPISSSSSAEEQQEEQRLADRYLKMLSTEVQVKMLTGENPYALTDIPLQVMIQRFLDNVEDSVQKNNGKVKGQSKLRGKDAPPVDTNARPTVAVLGTGWAAHAFIKLASTYDLRIVVVSPVNHFGTLCLSSATTNMWLHFLLLGPHDSHFPLLLLLTCVHSYSFYENCHHQNSIYADASLRGSGNGGISQHDGAHSRYQSLY
jgi:hypothetical protein